MAVARIVCSVSLRIELYDALDGADARLRAEATGRLGKASEGAQKAGDGQPDDAPALDAQGRKIGDEQPKRGRASFVLPQLQPIRWRLVRNSFRKADEFECTLPLSALPVPPAAIRALTCVVALRAVREIDWAAGVVDGEGGAGGGLRSQPTTGAGDETADFVGICHDVDPEIKGDKVPCVKLSFRDYVGILAGKKARVGAAFDEDLPISESVAKFLVGSPAEGLAVKWVDPSPEPTLGKYKGTLAKRRKGKSSKRAAPPQENYLDAIVRACDALGAVPRVVGPRIEIAYAGTMYEGKDRGGELAATILVASVVEGLRANHSLVGVKTHPVQVISFDVDTHKQYTARWPPGAGAKKVQTVANGKIPALAPVAANVGLPGFEQLDESILVVSVAPVADPSLLPRVAEALFLERTRQRVKFVLETHSPWADPSDPDGDGGALLRLQAGDNVKFAAGNGFGAGAAAAKILTGELGEANLLAVLVSSGVDDKVAVQVAGAIASVPRTDRFRVDELEVAGGDGEDAELRITLTTYTVIVSDLQAKANGESADEVVSNLQADAFLLSSLARDDVKKVFAEARRKVRDNDLDPAAEAAALARIDKLERAQLRGR